MRDHNYFENYVRKHKMLPQGYVETPEGKVLLADSDEAIFEDGRMFYRTAYALVRDVPEFASHADYEFGEPGGSVAEQKWRLNEAVKACRIRTAGLIKAGYFDASRKNDFSPRS